MKFNNVDVKSLKKFMKQKDYFDSSISEIIGFIKNNGERVFELKVGELYKTKGGDKAFIQYKHADREFCYRGCVEGHSFIFEWKKDGISCFSNNEQDITEYWVEESL